MPRGWTFLALALLSFPPEWHAAQAQSLSTNLYTGTGTVFIPYTNTNGSGVLTAPPAVKVGFENTLGTTNFTMDTGSVGLVVSPDQINTAGLKELQPGQITYSSSGIVQSGNYYETEVNYYNGNTVVATATVPVLVVSNQTCLPNARNCTPNPHPTGVSQMGIGFGQELGGQLGGTPLTNPFLNITSTASGTLPSRGYVISTKGVTLGLTAANTQGFAMVKLAPFPEFSIGGTEWVLAPADLSVNGTVGTGAVLSDTGVTGMYITPSPGASAQTITENQECGSDCAAPGTIIQVYLPGQANPVASYGFTLGAVVTIGSGPNNQVNAQNGNLLAPAFVSVDPADSTTFVNTTVNFFNGYDYYYDANNGFVGYRYTGAVSGAYGGSTPMIALQGNFTVPDGFQTNLPVYLMNYQQVAVDTTAPGRGFTDEPGSVVLTTSGTGLFSGPISGPGSLEIGGGAIFLSAANTYTGSTEIDAGAMLGLAGAGSISSSAGLTDNGNFDISLTDSGASVKSLAGAGSVALGSQTLTVTQAASTFAGTLSGAGGLAVTGGTETLGGANTYTGPTTIASGATLALSGTGSVAPSSGVTANGTFDISATSNGASIRSLSGTGSVALGSQSLLLTNASGSFGGTIGGSGGLELLSGAETLSGNNTYSGGTAVMGGAALSVTSDAALGASSGALLLNGGTLSALGTITTTRPVVIGSNGGSINANGYEISLDGPVVGTGAITLANGLTSINGSLIATSLSVGPGATLHGIGTINAPTTVAGTLSPGNSPGTLTFTAPVTLTPSSTTVLDIDGTGTGTGAGNDSRVLVTGAGNSLTAAGVLQPLLRGIAGSATNLYTPPIGQSFTVAAAAGGITGSFASLTQPQGLASGTRFDALYGLNTLSLIVTPAAYGDLAAAGVTETATEAAVGAALDASRPAAGGRPSSGQAGLYQPLYTQTAATIPTVLAQLAPTIYADNLMTERDAWSLVGSTVEQSLDAARGLSSSQQAQTATLSGGRRIWMSGLGQFTTVNSQGSPGYNGSAGGTAAGIDAPVLPWLRAGLAFGFTSPAITDGTGANLNGDGFEFLAYGAAQRGIGFVDIQAGGGFSETSVWRPQSLYGVQAQGQTQGTTGGGAIRAGLQLQAGAWQIQPSLSLAGVSLQQNGLTETQASATALSVAGSAIASLQTLLGAQVERSLALNDHMTLVPSAQIGWLHELIDTNAQATASLVATGGPSFVVTSPSTGRNAAVLGLGTTLHTGGPVSLYLAYSGTINAQSTAQDLTGGLSVTW